MISHLFAGFGSRPPLTPAAAWIEIVLGLTLGPVLFLVGLVWTGHQRDLARHCQRVQGSIVWYVLDRPISPRERPSHYPVFQYADADGNQHTITSKVGFVSGIFIAPAKVEVVYDKRAPGQAQIAAAEYFWFMPLLFMACGAGAAGHSLWKLWQRLSGR